MKNILSREDFLQKQYEALQVNLTNNEEILEENIEEINEGLLSNLFGALLKKDMWSTIKGDDTIKKEFKEIDDKLTGFYLTKIKNPNASQTVRQTLVDWAGEIYTAKKKKLEDLKDSDKKSEEFKNELLSVMSFGMKDQKEIEKVSSDKDFLKKVEDMQKAKKDDIEKLEKDIKKINDKYQKELDETTGSSPDLKRWANILKSRMNDIIDEVLEQEFDEGKEFDKILDEVKKEHEALKKKKNEEEARKQKEQLEKLDKERSDVLKKCGADITTEKSGVNFIKKVIEGCKTDALFEEKSIFDGKTKVNLENYKKSGLEKLLGINVKENNTALFDTLSTLNDVVISNISDDFKKTINDVSGVSMQAFFVSYCNLILACHTENEKLDDNLKTCMGRCSVYNNTMVGFGLPCADEMESKPDKDKVGMFVYYCDKTMEFWKKGSDVQTDKDQQGGGGLRTQRLQQFRKEIQERAQKLVEEYEKQQEQELKKEEQEQKKEEGK